MPAPAHCPTCGRPIEWSDAFPCRPFCSERCRLIDLGAWLSERHAIAGEPDPTGETDQQSEEEPKPPRRGT